MAAAMNGRRSFPAGFTLLELLLVLALLGLLASFGHWGSRRMLQGWEVRRAAEQLYEDLKLAQGEAERGGQTSLEDGALISRRLFLVFDPAARGYHLHLWQDRDADGVPVSAETTLLWQRTLPPGISYGWSAGVQRKACSNRAGEPSTALSFAAPDSAPCFDRPCIKFDPLGFSAMGPGAIYLNEGDQSLAITGTRPGHFTVCRWDGERWR